MTKLYAQPYDLDAKGFFFESAEVFEERSDACRNVYGERVEEFEIQFIDGAALDACLFAALGVHQGTISAFFDRAEGWDELQKVMVIVACDAGVSDFD